MVIQGANTYKTCSISLAANIFQFLNVTDKESDPHRDKSYFVPISQLRRVGLLLRSSACNRGLSLWHWPKTSIKKFQVLNTNTEKTWGVSTSRRQVSREGKKRHWWREFVREVLPVLGQMWNYPRLSSHCRSAASGQHILILIITLSRSLRKSRTTSWAGKLQQPKSRWPL